jgi:hypothetical protein
VQKGPVVYLALEGGNGFTRRVEAFRRRHSVIDAPFYLITDRTDLVTDHKELIYEITVQSSEHPALVVIKQEPCLIFLPLPPCNDHRWTRSGERFTKLEF